MVCGQADDVHWKRDALNLWVVVERSKRANSKAKKKSRTKQNENKKKTNKF